MRPAVSVLIAAYNAERFLEETLESALLQDYPNTEIVVVDDASSDGTPSLLERYRKWGIRVIRHEANRGVSAAVNTATSAATGEFIALLDHDDLWLPGKITAQMQFFELAPSVDVCFTDYVEFGDVEAKQTAFAERDGAMRRYPTQRVSAEAYVITSDSFLLDMVCIQAVPMPSTTVFRARTMKSALPLDENVAHQDVQLTFRLANRSRYGYIDRPLVRRRIHGSNWGTQMGTLRWLESHIKTLDSLPNWTTLSPAEQSGVTRLLGGYLRAAGYSNFQMDAMEVARRLYVRSLRADFKWKALLYLIATLLPPPMIALLRRLRRATAQQT